MSFGKGLQVFAGNRINASQERNFLLGKIEKIVGKGENADHQHFLLFQQCFQTDSFSDFLKVGFVRETVLVLNKCVKLFQAVQISLF